MAPVVVEPCTKAGAFRRPAKCAVAEWNHISTSFLEMPLYGARSLGAKRSCFYAQCRRKGDLINDETVTSAAA